MKQKQKKLVTLEPRAPFPETMTNIASATGSNAHLAEMGFRNGLDRFVYINPAQDGVVSAGTMATTLEAILGAVYIDSLGNMRTVRRVAAGVGLCWPS